MHGPRSIINKVAIKISIFGHDITLFQYLSYQNQNQHTAALFLYDVEDTHLHVVQSKLMEKCYSYMEKGSMHSTLASAGTFVSVYIRNDLLDQFSSGMFQKLKKQDHCTTLAMLTRKFNCNCC